MGCGPVDLAQHAITEVGLSERQYQALRNCFSKSQFTPQNTTSDVTNSAGMFSKRRWYTCPVTDTIFHLPEPLQPMYRVQEAIAAAVKPMGLHLSVDGKISERSFLSTLQQTFRRGAVCLKVFDVSRPAHPCFGIDHATISGSRDFTQGGITMGGCYKSGSLLSEQKHVTLCIGLHHDDGSGLQAMLGPKPASESAGEVRPAVVGIAAEFAALSDSGVLEVDGACIPCEPVVCLDFAAFRGITRKRGKCSALCACRGLAALQSYPGANGIPDLPSGDTVDDLHAARAIAQSQCGYGTAKLELPSLQSATHLLPEGWDFELNGPWHCSWCDEDVWTEFGQQTAFQLKLATLRARAASGAAESDSRKEAKKELDSILKEHADLHGDALLLEPLIMTNMSGTICMIVDPMHCLELNLAKTLWKYSFGDRMTAADRELVAEYLSAIGLHLDIREKGKRDPGQKWFSSAQVDEFVLGDAHYSKSKSPGLVKNILAIIELIFDKHTVADSLAAATDSSPPSAKKPKTARKDRHTAPIAGGYGAAEVCESGLDPASTAHLSIDELQGTAGDRASILSYLRQRYGNQAGVVIQILTAWEAYGELFAEWRSPWESDTDPYRAKRALAYARCARDFQKALCSLSNYKQKSWYTHTVVWIVWQQLWLYGNTWPLSTISIESRNARIKKIGLRFTNWRPLVQGFTAYSYVDRRSGQHVKGQRRYNSSAVHQLLKRVALSELSWHTTSKFTASDKLRLMTQLRSTLIKVKVADAPPSLPRATMRSELALKK